ncbi:uncharacterized protein LOC125714601 isoform X2 [Brienomyrus brachyistius]|uniref:uncharacterized protein LOC125714601 isoform X2 n=1 Tax=Brienomyrus brachyistius TaxID=42636 RepID=UPI0020B41D84|nr:uncharacterized protein LOC125714601 isoform X2 [Brienomyrus brachyistius]
MDNQVNGPKRRNQNNNILKAKEYIGYALFFLLDCLHCGFSFPLRALYKLLSSSYPEYFPVLSWSKCNFSVWPVGVTGHPVSCYIPVHTLVAGETFNAHETFMQKLKLQMELCSAESSNVILLFCPVVSRIGTDMEAAMDRVTEDKPVILVFMHHCRSSSHMTNITVQPSSNKIVQIVHCAFHESQGLLECTENRQAVAEVRSKLLQYEQRNRLSKGETII